jgi:hypothetical protein
MSFSLIKVLSISIFVAQNQKHKILVSLLQDHTKTRLNKFQYMLVQLLIKSYNENNIFKEEEIYKLIDKYIQNNSTKLCQNLLYN